MSDPQPPRIIAIVEAQRAALLARDTATLQRYVSQWRDVEDALKESIENLAYAMAERRASGNPVSQSSIYQMERYQTLLQQTRQQIQGYARQLAPQIDSEQASLWQQGQLDANDQIGAIVGTSFSRLPIEATNTLIGTTADGSPLRDTLLARWPNAVDAITRELLRGVALGTSPRVTARRAAAASGASLRQMLSVARTEQLRAYRESSRDLYQRSGVVKQYKRLAAKNARTCVLCLADDGTIYKVSEPLPIHVNCRCTSIAMVDGYTIETGKDGAEWFAAQSADTQRQMLGPSRYAMYKDGTPLSAFVGKNNDPVWGPQLTQRRLDQMASTPQKPSQPLAPLTRREQLLQDARTKRDAFLDTHATDIARLKNLNAQVAPLREERKALLNQGKDASVVSSQLNTLRAEINGINDRMKASGHQLFAVDNPTSASLLHNNRFSAKDRATMDDAARVFSRFVSRDVVEKLQVALRQTSGRDYATAKEIYMSGPFAGIVVHELGHMLDFREIERASRAFLERRTQGERAISMNDATGGTTYAKNEMTKPDAFVHPYIGLQYKNGGTEVVSMGLEYIFRDPQKILIEDADYYEFLYVLLRGGYGSDD